MSSGQPSIWRSVYNLVRCPGPPCHLGPYCWRDDVGKRHYRLKTHHLRKLIQFVEQGGSLESHDDLPEDIRNQLYAGEQQDVDRRRKRRATSPTVCPTVHITNVLPPQRSTESTPALAEATQSVSATRPPRLGIAGLRDMALRGYCAWQSSQVSDRALNLEYQKACAISLDEGLDLELVHEDQNADLYINKGVKPGIARRFVRDIETWAKHHAA
ncbi:hypothetical protein GE09DRAFT_980717 [Coniochaeta sp. 2T2.1]|nr:hypothetical protein GE09DRAFT_980717 [Coniochaeta sp. 2T2.1]